MRVECRKWFIHQQHVRLVGKNAGNLNALLHASGQLGGMLVILAM
jgi:hypothetical protein